MNFFTYGIISCPNINKLQCTWAQLLQLNVTNRDHCAPVAYSVFYYFYKLVLHFFIKKLLPNKSACSLFPRFWAEISFYLMDFSVQYR